ncbi:MAG: caspase family protein [Bacteroidaceae bacterium]|nr:caspase family protein [Bacteroidaceae bacterium]
MKKYTLLLFFLFGVSTNFQLSAQSLEDAINSHLLFKKLRIENAPKSDIYDALYDCYTKYVPLLFENTPNTQIYERAKHGLYEIHPFLQNGASYYSSQGMQQKALLFAQAYMDIPMMEAFKNDVFARKEHFATIAYFAAAGTFNIQDYGKAINYFKAYLSTNEQEHRKDVYTFMAKACINIKDYEQAMNVLDEACEQYPSDFNLLSSAINHCIEQKDYTNLQRFIAKAIELRPEDDTLQNIQGMLYEETLQFQKALHIYTRMKQANPNSLSINQHIALNYYNLGVLHYNKASIETDKKDANRYRRQSQEYFSAAATTLETIIANIPNSTKYMQALAIAYSCIGDQKQLETVNSKLSDIGGEIITVNTIPALISYSDKETTSPSSPSEPYNDEFYTSNSHKVPRYSQYAKEYVESRIKTWQVKDPYETVAEYQIRVNEQSRDAKVKELLKKAEEEYIDNYAKLIRLNDLNLHTYDADHETFLIESKYGNLVLSVPRANNEARIFENSWSGIQLKDPLFYINNDKLMLLSLTFVTPTGNTYRYDGDKALDYTETVVNINFDPIQGDLYASNSNNNIQQGNINRQEVKAVLPHSDVDINIPKIKKKKESVYALIIANENYSMVSKVPYALNDGEIFAQYCEKTLGLPSRNILLYRDASYGIMLNAMERIKRLSKARGGDIKIIFYYAGHGVPDETSREAYLLPIDSDGKQTKVCYPLNDLYKELGNLQAESVAIFLDACFSGAKRNGGMVTDARGVAIKPRPTAPTGRMVVFSAASDTETALPYEEKEHGMFTYFLLKKLQETKGNVTMKELGNYIRKRVTSESVLINNKLQTPTVRPSDNISEIWEDMKL